ncbi:MAG TPA: carboxypeptidase regulatory-like domain-containing protein [Xanthobacteraceae bacterium]|nr:carboxypeptidase regulatory-like domain-containing protein [Xanthobacteraceae bacterium]
MSVIRSTALAGIFLSSLLGVLLPVNPAFAELPSDSPNVALTGRVTSPQEGAMEGVLVSAQRAGSPITVTVVTNQAGLYSFPADRLSPGKYTLRIRAIGYELEGPAAVDVAAKRAVTADLALRKVDDISSQLTSTEWLISMPGGSEQKRPLIECMSCHTLERVVRSKFTAEEFVGVLKRMANYANNSTMQKVQARIAEREVPDDRARRVGEYLATVNLSKRDRWDYALKTLPRPTGAATRVIITEYDMPRSTIAPHDVRTDAEGFVWYSNFVEPYLGRLDPRTGAHTEFAYKLPKPNFPAGALALEPDHDGNWWLAMMFQGGVMKFDTRTRTFRHYPLPPELDSDTAQQSMVMPRESHVDGKVWTNDVNTHSILRLDVASGAYERVDPFEGMPIGANRQHSPYGMAADKNNDLYFMDFGDESVGRVDAKTFRATIYPTPTSHSRPRRTMLDDKGRLWFAEFAANKLAMFDIERESIKEWDAPTPHSYPYDVYLDRNGELWSGSMSDDRVLRFDPQTGKSIEYLLPRQTNIRRIFIDNSTTPVTFWAGNNHHAAIIKIEPLD